MEEQKGLYSEYDHALFKPRWDVYCPKNLLQKDKPSIFSNS